MSAQKLLLAPIVLHGGECMSRDKFFEFCQANDRLEIERTSEGDLLIGPACGGETGRRRAEVARQFGTWSECDQFGIALAHVGFWLPNGAERSPDLSWVRRERWEALSAVERKKFPPLAPDFVIELRSETDRMGHLQAKMQEYADNGVRLGWLIDPSIRRVEIYRPGGAPEVVDGPTVLSGEPELPGFVLDFSRVW
jgi:Uma2 family endonuclease